MVERGVILSWATTPLYTIFLQASRSSISPGRVRLYFISLLNVAISRLTLSLKRIICKYCLNIIVCTDRVVDTCFKTWSMYLCMYFHQQTALQFCWPCSPLYHQQSPCSPSSKTFLFAASLVASPAPKFVFFFFFGKTYCIYYFNHFNRKLHQCWSHP